MGRATVIPIALSAGMAFAFLPSVHAQSSGQALPPKLGQPPAPPEQGQQPRLRVLMSPSVASPMLLLPETSGGNGSNGLTGGKATDQPAPQSGSTNLYPKSSAQPANPASSGSASEPAPQGTSPSAEANNSSDSQIYSRYNPRPFLTAMLELRLTANTCDQYLPTSPDDATSQIEGFFTGLKRPAPTGTLKDFGRSLNMLIRSQAASVCQDRMNKALATYQNEARVYDEKKPKAWPAAPVIKQTNWCSTPNCIEVK